MSMRSGTLLAFGAALPIACASSTGERPNSPRPVATTAPAVATAPTPMATAVATVAPGAPTPVPAAKPSKWAACETAPKDMVCIPGGAAVIGGDDGPATEKPRHTVEVSTYYLDKYEATNEQYSACVKAGACPQRAMPTDPSFLKPKQPAVPLTWRGAHDYCLWAGKRLPTEVEWEKAARGGAEGRTYPWGSDEPTCARAHTVGCKPATTLDVGSLPAGAYGIFDMAGNGYEWVQDWSTPSHGACGDDCLGLDPRGPCAGAAECQGKSQRLLKGGSWFWPASETRGAWRKAKPPQSGMHRLSVRCASSHPLLATWPPLAFSDPPAKPADPKPPSKAELQSFAAVPDDDDVLKIKPCKRVGDATLSCRDPHSYLLSNEPQQFRWLPYIENLGGGYVGIGAAQSYSFIAAARSQWAWIFDYDPAVVRLHLVLRTLILEYDTPAALVDALDKPKLAATVALVRQKLAAEVSKEELPTLEYELKIAAQPLRIAYKKELSPPPEHGRFGWLGSLERYRYVRQLYQQGRILVRKGNLVTDKVMPAIAVAAQKLEVPVRILYTSNADDQWALPPRYHQNLTALPYDDQSVVLRTIYPRHKGGHTKAPWDYTVHWAKDMARWMKSGRVSWMWWLNHWGLRHDPGNVVTIALPGKTPR